MEGTVFAVMAPADEEEIFSMYRRAAEKGRLDGSSHWNADYPDRETLREDLARGGVYGLKRRGRLLAVISAEGNHRLRRRLVPRPALGAGKTLCGAQKPGSGACQAFDGADDRRGEKGGA